MLAEGQKKRCGVTWDKVEKGGIKDATGMLDSWRELATPQIWHAAIF